MTKTKKISRLRLFSYLSLALAVILLCASIPGIVSLVHGLRRVESVTGLSRGDFVRIEVTNIQAIYAERYDVSKPERVTRLLAVTKLGDKLVTVSLPARYFDTAEQMLGITELQQQNGILGSTSFTVEGTIAEIDKETRAIFSDWFSASYSVLASYGVIPTADCDYSNLSGAVIKADFVGGYPNIWSLTIVIALAVASIFLAFILQTLDSRPGKGTIGNKPLIQDALIEADKPNVSETAELSERSEPDDGDA